MTRTPRALIAAATSQALLVAAGHAATFAQAAAGRQGTPARGGTPAGGQGGREGAPGLPPGGPTGTMEALVAWVEENNAPETLLAVKRDQTALRTRPLCQYPQVAKYKGNGCTDDARTSAAATDSESGVRRSSNPGRCAGPA